MELAANGFRSSVTDIELIVRVVAGERACTGFYPGDLHLCV